MDANALVDFADFHPDIDRLVEAFKEAPVIMERIEKEQLHGFIVVRREGGKDAEPKLPQPKKEKKKRKGAEVAGGDDSASATAAAAPALPDSTPSATPALLTTAAADSAPAAPAQSSGPPTADAAATNGDDEQKREGGLEVYSEYLPFLLAQHRLGDYSPSQCQMVEFPSLDAAMDEFYSRQEEQREEVRLLKEKAAALHKVERVKQSHAAQLSSLTKDQEENRRKAELIEVNTAAVDAAIASINAELARGTDWKEIQRIVKEQKQLRNPIALLVSALKLDENTVTLSLSPDLAHLHPSFSYATATPEQRPVKVDIDLSLSAFTNASTYYSLKKAKVAKHAKTSEASAMAIKAAVRKTEQALKEVDVRARIQKIRKIFWWESAHTTHTSPCRAAPTLPPLAPR